MTKQPDLFADIVDAIRSEIEPGAILLFGSRARGDAGPDSDIDLLVIREADFRPGESRLEELGNLYRAVTRRCKVPKDILLFTRSEFDTWRTTTNHMLANAAREGKVLCGRI